MKTLFTFLTILSSLLSAQAQDHREDVQLPLKGPYVQCEPVKQQNRKMFIELYLEVSGGVSQAALFGVSESPIYFRWLIGRADGNTEFDIHPRFLNNSSIFHTRFSSIDFNPYYGTARVYNESRFLPRNSASYSYDFTCHLAGENELRSVPIYF